jgi:hypothetical protein
VIAVDRLAGSDGVVLLVNEISGQRPASAPTG